MNADYQVKVISSIPLGGQFSLSILQNLRWEAGGDIKYVILVEDSDTGGPSSITVRIEYLFAFFWRRRGGASRKSHFYFCSWCYSRK